MPLFVLYNMLMKLKLDLPPSVNALHINRKGSYKRILTEEGRYYIYQYSNELRAILKKHKHVPIDELFHLDIEWVLPNRNCDSHNFGKALYDMLEKAGLCTNDKYIMPRTQSVNFDTKKPHVTIEWENQNPH